jgi:hypothetical protein
VLVECATHAIIGAHLGAYRASEWPVCKPLMQRLSGGMLRLADRLLPPQKDLPDGSYPRNLVPTGVGKARALAQAITVRVIECALPGLPDAQPRCRLLTTLPGPQAAPVLESAALYHRLWQVE